MRWTKMWSVKQDLTIGESLYLTLSYDSTDTALMQGLAYRLTDSDL